MIKQEILLTGCAIVLALSGQEAKAAEACTAVPSCAELGYTQTNCNGFVSLKCPFDKNKLFCGRGACEPGYIYGDVTEKCGTKNPDFIYFNSTAIGVAVNSNLVIALTDEGGLTWDAAVAKCKAKTTGYKKWRLPTMNEILAFWSYEQQTVINAKLQAAGGDKLSNGYWTGTEYSADQAYLMELDAHINAPYSKDTKPPVRCVFDI